MLKFPADFAKFTAGAPLVDFGRLLELQQRNFEAILAANTRLAEGAQEILKRQVEMVHGALQESFAAAREMGAPTDVEKQIGTLKASAEKGIANARELAELASRSGTDAVEILRKRAAASVEELGSLFKTAA